MEEIEAITRLSDKLNYKFKNKDLLELALTHRSYSKNNNERLEYLGDAILGFIIAEALYRKYPKQSEGVLTRLRAGLVKRETLASLARALDIGPLLKFGPGEKKTGGWRRDSILSNAVEAIIGALYLDSNLKTCKRVVLKLYQERLSVLSVENLGKDPKTELQEYLQSKKQKLPNYAVIDEEGEAHLKQFTVECSIQGIDQKITGKGKSKQNAEQLAARKMLDLLNENVDGC